MYFRSGTVCFSGYGGVFIPLSLNATNSVGGCIIVGSVLIALAVNHSARR